MTPTAAASVRAAERSASLASGYQVLVIAWSHTAIQCGVSAQYGALGPTSSVGGRVLPANN